MCPWLLVEDRLRRLRVLFVPHFNPRHQVVLGGLLVVCASHRSELAGDWWFVASPCLLRLATAPFLVCVGLVLLGFVGSWLLALGCLVSCCWQL